MCIYDVQRSGSSMVILDVLFFLLDIVDSIVLFDSYRCWKTKSLSMLKDSSFVIFLHLQLPRVIMTVTDQLYFEVSSSEPVQLCMLLPPF